MLTMSGVPDVAIHHNQPFSFVESFPIGKAAAVEEQL